jgi:hypothetical protein
MTAINIAELRRLLAAWEPYLMSSHRDLEAALHAAAPALLDAYEERTSAFQCKHGRPIVTCIGCDTEAETDLTDIMAQRDAAIARAEVAENDARHMRQIIELLADQPGSKAHREACRALLERTKNATWL